MNTKAYASINNKQHRLVFNGRQYSIQTAIMVFNIMNSKQCDWLIAKVFSIKQFFSLVMFNVYEKTWKDTENVYIATQQWAISVGRRAACIPYTHFYTKKYFAFLSNAAFDSHFVLNKIINSNEKWSNIQSCWSIVKWRIKYIQARVCDSTEYILFSVAFKSSKQILYRWSPCIKHCLRFGIRLLFLQFEIMYW